MMTVGCGGSPTQQATSQASTPSEAQYLSLEGESFSKINTQFEYDGENNFIGSFLLYRHVVIIPQPEATGVDLAATFIDARTSGTWTSKLWAAREIIQNPQNLENLRQSFGNSLTEYLDAQADRNPKIFEINEPVISPGVRDIKFRFGVSPEKIATFKSTFVSPGTVYYE